MIKFYWKFYYLSFAMSLFDFKPQLQHPNSKFNKFERKTILKREESIKCMLQQENEILKDMKRLMIIYIRINNCL